MRAEFLERTARNIERIILNHTQVLEEASARVELRPCNAVTSVAVDAASVPLTPVPAGADVAVVVEVATEDGNPVPLPDVMRGLALQVMAPGTKSRAAQVCGSSTACLLYTSDAADE